MNKNIKRMFFVLTLVTLLATVGAVCAADDANSTTATDNTVSDVATVSDATSDTIAVEPAQTTSDDNKVDTKTIEKESKNIKRDPVTIDGVTYINVIENQVLTLDDFEYDQDVDRYMYYIEENTFFNNVTINGQDNSQLSFFSNGFINNSKIYSSIYLLNDLRLEINNSELDYCLRTQDGSTIIVDEQTIICKDFYIGFLRGNVITNNVQLKEILKEQNIYIGNNTIENLNINDNKLTVSGNLTIINCTINTEIEISKKSTLTSYNSTINQYVNNNGKIIFDDNSNIGNNFNIEGLGKIETNNTNIINSLEQRNIYVGNRIIENKSITKNSQFNGKITLINCNITSMSNENHNILTLKDCTITLTNPDYSWIINYGTLIINNNTKITGQIFEQGVTIYGEFPEGYFDQPTEYNGENTIVNVTLVRPFTNNGQLTLTNCQINTKITNNGNLTLVNCSFSNQNISVGEALNTEGFMLNNLGNSTLINCSVENNTFNTTARQIYLNNYPLSGAIANKGNLIVNNCSFQNNTVGYKIHVNDGSYFGTDYMVGDASCIFNNGGNLTVNNSLFKDNYAGRDAGAILSTNNYIWSFTTESVLQSEANITIINTEFINNTANNTNIGVNITGIDNIIENSTFTNTNIQANNLTLNNNTITNNTSINVADTMNMSSNNINRLNINAMNIFATDNTLKNGRISATGSAEIINNTFTDQASLSLTNAKTVTIHNNQFTDNNYTYDTITLPQNKSNTQIYNNTYTNTGLNDNINWNIAPKLYLNDTISATYTITNPENYDENIQDNITFNIYINNQLQTTTNTLENIPLNKTGQITLSIKPNKSSQTFTQYLDVLKIQDITITPENYDSYIKEGTLTKVKEDNRVLFNGNFTNKGEIYIDTDDIVIDGTNAHFTNTTFTIDSQNTIIKNMNINNTDTTYPIDNHGKNNYIINNNINITNTDEPTAAIKNTATKTTIQNNTLYVDGPAKSIDYTENGIANTQAILIQNTNRNTITNNNITVTTTQESQTYGTIEAITANTVTDTTIKQNNINISNAKFTYGINMLASVTDNIITENNITATSYRYCDGIQVGNQAQNIEISKNNINIYCHNTTPVDEEAISYGIITSNMGQGTSTQINITQNNITIDSTVGYGIEIYQTTNTEIRNNTINVTGAYSMGIGYAHSPNSHVVANNIYTRGDSSQTLGAVTEEIQPENVGIKIQQDSTNIKIDDGWIYGRNPIGPNIIHTNDKAGNDYAINVESTGATIEGNKLRCSNGAGANAIKNNTPYSSSTGNTFDNIYVNIDIKTPETIIVNQTTPITITIKDEYNNPLTLTKIDYENPIYDEETQTTHYNTIKDNITITMTINNQTENITITEDTTTYCWTPTTTGPQDITATFQEKDRYNHTTATKTITVSTIELYVEPITTTANDIINITAKIQIDNQTATDITKGKVTFKVNGKTLKDENGKVIYAKVVNGTATIENYVVPDDWAKDDTTIQAVYSGSTQCEKLTSEKTNINITPEELTLTTTATQASPGQTTTLTATLSDNTINTGKIVFKINGKTVKDANGKVIYAKVTNGTVSVDYTLPESYKAGNYTVTATFIASGYDKLVANTTMTVEN